MNLRRLRILIGILIPLLFTVASAQQIEIVEFYAKVYLAPNEASRFIGLAQQGETYEVLETREPWKRIKFKNAVGWIQQSQTRLKSASNPPLNDTEPRVVENTNDSRKNDSIQNLTVQPQNDTYSPPLVSSQLPVQQPKAKAASEKIDKQEDKSDQKRDSKLKNWFSPKNLLSRPPVHQPIDDLELKYFLVKIAPAKVLLYLSPDAPMLGMARKGDLLPLVGEGDSWCKVSYKDTTGWIERKNGSIVDAPKSLLLSDFLNVIIVLGIFGVIAAILLLIVIIFRKKNKTKTTDINLQKSVLIIAKSSMSVQYTLTDSSTTLDECFSEIGFKVNFAKEFTAIRNSIEKSLPDIMIVDWRFERNVLNSLEQFFSSIPGSSNIFVIVYNSPDPANMPSSEIFPKMSYLGQTFTDRDIFKLVTPLIVSDNSRAVKNSTNSSALEGKIAGGNLIEVLQFIEIGSKTGCLLIETDHPFGLIYFYQGRIIYAATAQGIVARDAINMVLDLKGGSFRFIVNRKPKSSNVNLSTLEVLMEWTKAVDEAHGR
jgi:hypothetical protein